MRRPDEPRRRPEGGRAGWVWLVLVLPVVAVLTPRPFPTCDGPSHAALAWVLRHQGAGDSPLVTRLVEPGLAWRPNALAQVLLAAFQTVASPVAADSAVLLVIVLLLATGGWYLAGAGGRGRADWLLPLAVCLTPAYPLYMGFYNFSLGVALALLALGVLARFRGRSSTRRRAAFVALAWLTTAAHVIPATLLAASAGVLWTWRAALGIHRVRRRGQPFPGAALARRAWPVAVALAPVVLVCVSFHGQRAGGYRRIGIRYGLERLLTLELLAVHLEPMVVVTTLLGFGLAALVAWRVAGAWLRGRVAVADAFLLLLAGAVLLVAIGPDAYRGASFLQRRWVWLAAWLTLPCVAGARLGPRLRAVVALAGTAFALVIYGANLRVDLRLSARAAGVLAAARHIAPGEAAMVLPLDIFPGAQVGVHARSRLIAADHHLGQWPLVTAGSLDVLQYQLGEFDYFLRRFRAEANMRRRYAEMYGDWPMHVDVAGWTAATGVPLRYVLVAGDAMDDEARRQLRARLDELPPGYELVYDDLGDPRVRLWERRGEVAGSAEAHAGRVEIGRPRSR